MVIVLISSINIIFLGSIGLFNELENLQFDMGDVYISSKNEEESGYGLYLDLLTSSHESHVSHPKTIGLFEKKTDHLRPIYCKVDRS